MESNNKLMIAVQDTDNVTIPRRQYDQLLDAETRLNILISQRVADIRNNGSTYQSDNDHILGQRVLDAHASRRLRDKQKEAAGEDYQGE